MNPKVSICIPVYRQTQFLARTLDSITHQQFGDYEVVVSDDSPDGLVESLVHKYDLGSKLRYFRNPERLGSPANWNRAVGYSRGEYIKIMHHDDWFTGPDSLGQFVAMLDRDSSAGMAFSGANARTAATGRTRHHFASEHQLARLLNEPTSLFCGNFIGPPSATIIRRAAFRAFPEDLVWLVDIAQFIQILQDSSFVSTREPLIVCTTQAAHQVTRECADDVRLNLYEYFSLYDRIRARIPAASRPAYVDTLLELVYRCKVRSRDDIRLSGYQGDLPDEVQASLEASALARSWQHFRLRFARGLRNR